MQVSFQRLIVPLLRLATDEALIYSPMQMIFVNPFIRSVAGCLCWEQVALLLKQIGKTGRYSDKYYRSSGKVSNKQGLDTDEMINVKLKQCLVYEVIVHYVLCKNCL